MAAADAPPSPFQAVDEACPHAWDESNIRVPRPSDPVYKQDCAYCARTAEHGEGIFVCMCCFLGVCRAHLSKHLQLHPYHAMYTVVHQLPAPPEDEGSAPRDTNLLGIVRPPEFEYRMVCGVCQVELVPGVGCPATFDAYERIILITAPGVQDAVAALSDHNRKTDCPHVRSIVQSEASMTATTVASSVCAMCPNVENNWMCMTCGSIGCPRKEAGGQEHAILHSLMTSHMVVYKIGTITAGHGDVYCYGCQDMVFDPAFAQHMKHFGIDVESAVKTSKTIGEMEYDLSSQWDFDKITESGTSLVPRFGPRFTGLRNFGNTCYMASVLQCLIALDPFREALNSTAHRMSCTKPPLDCAWCQVEAVVHDLCSGEFSRPLTVQSSQRLNGVTPRKLKHVIARKTHFASGEQQDAAEYLSYFLDELQQRVALPSHPEGIFPFVVQEASECGACHAVKRRERVEKTLQLRIPVDPVDVQAVADSAQKQLDAAALEALRPRCSLEDCFTAYLQPSAVECSCESCGASATTYWNSQTIRTFPDVLVVNPRREYFDRSTLSVRKLDVLLDIPLTIDVERMRTKGPRLAEPPVLPTAALANPVAKPLPATETIPVAAVEMIEAMGIPKTTAVWALQETQGDVERAVDFIFSHPEGPPPSITQAPRTDEPVATPPTTWTDGPAQYKLKAMISHMGASATTGHYVCHVFDEATGKWILFNDEKVAESSATPFSLGSIFFYVRAPQGS